MRAAVDTNVWVSAMLNPAGAPARVLAAYRAGQFTLIDSEPLLTELEEVLGRPRIVRRSAGLPLATAELLVTLRERAEIVPVTGAVHLCRDPDDDVLIETALRGEADVLVSRDDDLKGDWELVDVLAGLGVAVATVRQFLAMLDAEQPA